MNCDLAHTGTPLPWLLILLVAVVLLVTGIAITRRTRAGCIMAVLLVVTTAGLLAAAPASTAQAACTAAPAVNSLTITQTSTNSGLSPTQPPSLITGRVTNNGPDDTFVTAVIVTIGAVTMAPGAAAGSCDASDYILIDPRMPVDSPLAASGGSAAFSGAHIGFTDKPSNQDACQGAVVDLHYVTE